MRGRRSFLRDSALTAGAVVGLSASPAAVAFASQAAPVNNRRGSGGKPLSRQFAQWVVGLRYDDLPAAVVDRAKGLTLQNLASALIGSQMPAGQQAVKFVVQEFETAPPS
jgi:hypothetical protein